MYLFDWRPVVLAPVLVIDAGEEPGTREHTLNYALNIKIFRSGATLKPASALNSPWKGKKGVRGEKGEVWEGKVKLESQHPKS